MSPLENKIKNDANCIYTNSTAVAAALATLGFQLKPERSLIRTYTKSRPPGTLGIFHFRLEPVSETWGTADSAAIRRNWITRECEEEFDTLKREIAETASRGVLAAASQGESAKPALEIVQQKFTRLMELMPAKLMSTMSVAEQNHQDIKDKMKEVCLNDADGPMRRIDHPGRQTYTMVPANMPDHEIAALMSKAL